MSEFQLDVSDCEAMKSVMVELQIPVFLFHVQVRNRPSPPTVEYVPTGMWWVPTREMDANLRDVRNRPRETRPAAYFRTGMFRPIASFPVDVNEPYLAEETQRIRSGEIPSLYHLNVTSAL
jgi:hypothetical protein